MSVASSLTNALSGLTAAARAAEVVSSNVANALTEGYGRRGLELVSYSLGGNGAGVRVVSTTRAMDPVVLGDRRIADASLTGSSARSAYFKRIEEAVGTPSDDFSLSARVASLESRLIEAASRPDSEARLSAVQRTAAGFADQVNSISDQIQAERMRADQQIQSDVATVNSSLQRIERLSTDIQSHLARGNDATALLDQRQVEVDRIARILPIREVPRDGARFALMTPTGVMLLDGKASVLGFAAVGVITPDMTQASGALSGLTVNGKPLQTGGDYSGIGDGSLGASFAIRDELAVTAQTELDAFARDLVERFADPALDPTVAPGDPGLFTDQGTAFDPLNEIGLSARLSLNAAVDPDQGGALWRLRDGLGATVQGDVGDASLLQAFGTALTLTRTPASGAFASTVRSSSGLASDFLSRIGTDRQSTEESETFHAARYDALKVLELQDGVDTDMEMQQLLLIEQAYAANARVVQTVDDMIQQLLRL